MERDSYTVDIEFTRPRGFKPFSYLIRLFEGTPYSHVRVKWKTLGGSEIIYEAAGSSVRFIGPRAVQNQSVIICKTYRTILTRDNYRLFLNKCIELAGVEYGVLQILGILYSRIWAKKTNPLADKKKTIVCSELVFYLLQEVFKFETKIDPDLAGPRELDKQLSLLHNNYNLFLLQKKENR